MYRTALSCFQSSRDVFKCIKDFESLTYATVKRESPPLLMPIPFRAPVRTPRLGYTNKMNNNDNKNMNEYTFRIHKALTKVVETDS
jgi:hypothetical protein